MADQIMPNKVADIVSERNVYTGPLGDGYTDVQYRMVGDDIECKKTHVGPEARTTHDWTVVADKNETESQQTSTRSETMDVVKIVETVADSGEFDKRITVEETYNQPVYTDVAVVTKHPYKARFFGA